MSVNFDDFRARDSDSRQIIDGMVNEAIKKNFSLGGIMTPKGKLLEEKAQIDQCLAHAKPGTGFVKGSMLDLLLRNRKKEINKKPKKRRKITRMEDRR
jgi:hypothetical protein